MPISLASPASRAQAKLATGQLAIDRAFVFNARNGSAEWIATELASGKRPSDSAALLDAALYRHFACARALLPFCDANARDNRGVDALRLTLSCSWRANHLELARELLAAGADPSMLDSTGRDALGWAITGSRDGAELVLPFCNPNLPADQGYTPLMLAAFNARSDLVDLLLPVSDLETRNSDGFRAHEIEELHPYILAQISAFRDAKMERAALDEALPSPAARSAKPRV